MQSRDAVLVAEIAFTEKLQNGLKFIMEFNCFSKIDLIDCNPSSES